MDQMQRLAYFSSTAQDQFASFYASNPMGCSLRVKPGDFSTPTLAIFQLGLRTVDFSQSIS